MWMAFPKRYNTSPLCKVKRVCRLGGQSAQPQPLLRLKPLKQERKKHHAFVQP